MGKKQVKAFSWVAKRVFIDVIALFTFARCLFSCQSITRLYFYGMICLLFFHVHLIHAVFEPHPWNKTEGRACKVALCCVFKNEAEWLREWIEFHKLIGITHFYLYNNVSTDHYLEVLTPYLLSGEVELFEYPSTPLKLLDQKAIYDHAISISKGLSQWLAIIDTDEFIVPLETKDLVTYLNQFPKHIGGVEINWQTFGTSGVKSLKPGELLIEKLILKAPFNSNVNTWFKSIVRPHRVLECANAHSCHYYPGFTAAHVTPCIQQGQYPVPESEAAVSKIRIHHYVWRTEDYFYQVKLPRIHQWDANFFQVHSPIDYLPITNSVLDDSMSYFVPPLKQILFPKGKKR
jgi:hypothetical protein